MVMGFEVSKVRVIKYIFHNNDYYINANKTDNSLLVNR